MRVIVDSVTPSTRTAPEASLGLIYLALPAALFLAAYVRLALAVPLLLLLALAVLRSSWFGRFWRGDAAAWLTAGAAAVLVLILTGFPDGPFPWDWFKHWALLHELSRHPWSLQTQLRGSRYFLRYYLGAYLVPALAHHWVPALPIRLSTAAWFALGCVLLFRIVCSLAASPLERIAAVVLMLLLGGADYYAMNIARWLLGWPPHPALLYHDMQWSTQYFGLPLAFSPLITLLAWVPQQSIATLLVTAMLVYADDARTLGQGLLGYGLLALYSPYGMIGLSPLVAAVAITRHRDLPGTEAVLGMAAGLGFALLCASYLGTDLHVGGSCFACMASRIYRYDEYLPFLACELLPFALILGRRLLDDRYCGVCLATLLAIPLAHGTTADFVMRGSAGPLFVLGLRSVQALLSREVPLRRRLIQAVALLLCMPTTVSEMAYLHTAGQAHRAITAANDPLALTWLKTFAVRTDYTVPEFFNTCGWTCLNQYFSVRRPWILRAAR